MNLYLFLILEKGDGVLFKLQHWKCGVMEDKEANNYRLFMIIHLLWQFIHSLEKSIVII